MSLKKIEEREQIKVGRKFEKDFIRFAKMVGKTKKIRRTGWKNKAKIDFGETIAEHMYRLAILSMVICDERGLNTEKILRMSLLHDLGEVVTGDLMPQEKFEIGREKSLKLEENGLKKIFNHIPNEVRENYIDLWKEIQFQNTDEAKLIKYLDKLEMAIQAIEYIEDGYDKDKLEQFIISAKESIKDKQLLGILQNRK